MQTPRGLRFTPIIRVLAVIEVPTLSMNLTRNRPEFICVLIKKLLKAKGVSSMTSAYPYHSVSDIHNSTNGCQRA